MQPNHETLRNSASRIICLYTTSAGPLALGPGSEINETFCTGQVAQISGKFPFLFKQKSSSVKIILKL